MPYPDLPPQPTFWRCPTCGNEQLFRANGTGAIACGSCGQSWTVQQLLDAHAQAHPAPAQEPTAKAV
jgi:transcription elongation factor Elf1